MNGDKNEGNAGKARCRLNGNRNGNLAIYRRKRNNEYRSTGRCAYTCPEPVKRTHFDAPHHIGTPDSACPRTAPTGSDAFALQAPALGSGLGTPQEQSAPIKVKNTRIATESVRRESVTRQAIGTSARRQPIHDLAQIIPLHRVGQMVVEGRREEEGSRMEGGRREGARKEEGKGGEGLKQSHTTPSVNRQNQNHSPRPQNKPPHTPALQTSPPSRLPYASLPRQGREQRMDQHEPRGVREEEERVKRFPTGWRGRGRYGRRSREGVCWECEERGEEEDTQGRDGVDSQIPTSSTFDIEDLGPRTKDGLGQAGEDRAMAGGGMGELELLSVWGERAVDIILRMVNERKERKKF
ncbi:hypothetical protein B0H13DRAFT_1865257 [Mycena leptocephala]|nr:hypothetical protein B0H13DRAFT_1865257 [Mycena leptocephala]